MSDTLRRIIELQQAALERGVLSMWTVYDHPKDHPQGYIARRWEASAPEPTPTTDIIEGELTAMRHAFNRAGLYCLKRHNGDDPKILETWL